VSCYHRRDTPVPAGPSDAALPPFSAALVETERRTGAPVGTARRAPVAVDPRRYRTRPRRERLEACLRLLAVAVAAAAWARDGAADPFARLSRALVLFFRMPILSFPSRAHGTPFQHGDGGGPGLRSPPSDAPVGGRPGGGDRGPLDRPDPHGRALRDRALALRADRAPPRLFPYPAGAGPPSRADRLDRRPLAYRGRSPPLRPHPEAVAATLSPGRDGGALPAAA